MSAEALFVPVKEAAAMLGISDDLVYDLAARGELPCATFGSRRMIPRRAIELVLDEALAGFDPAALLVTLADAAGSAEAPPAAEPSGPARPSLVPDAPDRRSPRPHLSTATR